MNNVQCVWRVPFKYVPNPEHCLWRRLCFVGSSTSVLIEKNCSVDLIGDLQISLDPGSVLTFLAFYCFLFFFFSLRFKLHHMTLDILDLCRRWERRKSTRSLAQHQHSKQSKRESHNSIFRAIKLKEGPF